MAYVTVDPSINKFIAAYLSLYHGTINHRLFHKEHQQIKVLGNGAWRPVSVTSFNCYCSFYEVELNINHAKFLDHLTGAFHNSHRVWPFCRCIAGWKNVTSHIIENALIFINF